jgi:hypothetical protein
MSDWIKALQEVNASLRAARASRAEAVPSGWHTSEQLETVFSLSGSGTARMIREFLAAGRAEKQSFAVVTKTGRILRVPHYRLLKKGKP